MKKIQAQTLIDFMERFADDIEIGYRKYHGYDKSYTLRVTFSVDLHNHAYYPSIYFWHENSLDAVASPHAVMKYIKRSP